MPNPTPVSLWVALGAGVLSFFTPCVLPMVPVYVLYITEAALGGSQSSTWRNGLRQALFFSAGFGVVFVLGGVTAGLLGSVMPRVIGYVIQVGGALLIIFGLHMMGVLSIPLLNMGRRPNLDASRGPRYWRSLIVGVTFAAGWTPCVGPALASILSLAAYSRTASTGALLLAVYSLGLAVPFVAVATLSGVAVPLVRRLARHAQIISVVGGVFLVIMGLLLVSGYWQALSFWLNSALAA